MNASASPQSSAEQEQLALETLRKQRQEIISYLNSIKPPMSPAQIATVISTLHNWMRVFESYKSQKESEWPEFSQQLDFTLKDLSQAIEIYRNMNQSTSSTLQQIQKIDSSTTLYPSTGRTEQHFQQILGTNENLTDERVPQTPSNSPSPSKKQPNIAIAMHALSDAPADKQQDLLGFEIYATALSDFILNEKTEKPLRILIDAPWGMGKTTLMQMIKAQLESQSKQRLPSPPLIVWFNAWMYDKEESLWAAFILNVLQDVRKKFSWFQRAKLWLRLNRKRMDWTKFWQSIFLPLVAGIGLLALGIWLYFYSSLQQGDTLSVAIRQILGTLATGLSGIALLYKTAKTAQSSTTSPFNLKLSTYLRVPNYQERAGFLTQFRDDLDIVMESVTQGGRRSLIIFIDDLDRCAPAKTVEIVEAMNFLLDAKYCIFVLGLDTRMVAASIEAKYDTMQKFIDDISEADGIPFGQQFLEKIAQLTFRIPRSDKMLISSFVTALGQISSISVPQERSTNITEISSSIPDTLVSVDGQNQKLTMVSSYQSQEQFAVQMNDSSPVQKAIEHVAPYLEPNPRKIKRFINIFRLQAFIANRRNLLVLDEADYYLDLLARWVALITQWPIVLDRTLADIAFIAHLREAYNLYSDLQDLRFNSDNEPGKHDVLIKKLEPYFEDEHIKQLVGMVGISILSTFTNEDIQKLPTFLSSTQAVVPSVQKRIVSPPIQEKREASKA